MLAPWSNKAASAAHPKRVKVGDAPVPEADDCAGPVAAQVHWDDELVTLQHCGAVLAPPLQPHLGRPPPHIVVHVLLVIPAPHIDVGVLTARTEAGTQDSVLMTWRDDICMGDPAPHMVVGVLTARSGHENQECVSLRGSPHVCGCTKHLSERTSERVNVVPARA